MESLPKENVLSIGFPATSLTSVFCDYSIEKLNEKRICVPFGTIDEIAYKEWVNEHTKNVVKIGNETEKVGCAGSDSINHVVLQKLKDFNISSSTPVDCMMFVCELQKMLLS